MATDGLTVKVEFDKENAMNCVKNVIMEKYGMTLDELAELCKAKQAGRLREDVQGEWLHDHTDMVGGNFAVVRCSVCGYKAYAIADHIRNGNFCPNCGARMVGGGER